MISPHHFFNDHFLIRVVINLDMSKQRECMILFFYMYCWPIYQVISGRIKILFRNYFIHRASALTTIHKEKILNENLLFHGNRKSLFGIKKNYNNAFDFTFEREESN